jgi:hypothetical protein
MALNELLQLHLDQSTKRKGDVGQQRLSSIMAISSCIGGFSKDFLPRFSTLLVLCDAPNRISPAGSETNNPLKRCPARPNNVRERDLRWIMVQLTNLLYLIGRKQKEWKRILTAAGVRFIGRQKTINQINAISKKPHTKAFSFIRFIPAANEITHAPQPHTTAGMKLLDWWLMHVRKRVLR